MTELAAESNVNRLGDILRALCNGNEVDELINSFVNDCESLTRDEVSTVFIELENGGYDYKDSLVISDFYHVVVEDKVAAGIIKQFEPGHPVGVYLEENRLLKSLFVKIRRIDPRQNTADFQTIYDQICKVELHYVRKENQLFPCLEKHGWDSPSKNMWSFHDEIRADIKEVGIALKGSDFDTVAKKLTPLIDEMYRLMNVEEQHLLPNAIKLLDEDDWKDMRIGDEEIGWMLDEAPVAYPKVKEEEYVHPSKLKHPSKQAIDTEGKHHYDEGYMTPEQVNLLFRTMPLDITYVDENDQVVFYNRGEDRLFPRSKNVIGREVRYCHPPKSVDSVLRILEEFRSGTKDAADFRINIKGRFVLIQYFAVRDNAGTYRGVMEMSQDITDIKTFEGEKRLLNWD